MEDNPRLKNLVPISQRTPEERKAMGHKGGTRAGQTRKKRKSLESALSMLLALPIKDERKIKDLEKMGVKKGDLKLQTQMLVALIRQANRGSVRAFEAVRDTLGETTNRVQLETTNVDSDITSVNIKTLEVLKEHKIEGFEEFDDDVEEDDNGITNADE